MVGKTMSLERHIALVRAICHQINLALWALLTAFALYFAVIVAPKLPEMRAAAERRQLQEIAAENEAYCAKWHMHRASSMHDECLSELQELRTRIANRLAEGSYW